MAPGSTLAGPSPGPSHVVQLCEHEFGQPMQLLIIEGDEGGPTILEVRADGFPSEADAQAAGETAKYALRVAAIQSDLGLDLGDDQARSGMASALRETMERAAGSQIIMDVHGLYVYEGSIDAKVFRASATLTVGKDANTFARDFSSAYENEVVTSERTSLAIDLYGLSKFETSERARFLALVSALEVLSERSSRPTDALKHLEALIEYTKEAAEAASDRPAMDSLLGSLNDLRLKSISAAVRELARDLGGPGPYRDLPPERFVQHCYQIRSELTHQGTADDPEEPRSSLEPLAALVATVIRRALAPVT